MQAEIISTPTVLYDVLYCESQDHPSIQCRVKAFDIDQVVDYVKGRYSAYTYIEEHGDPDYSLYLMIDVCPKCLEWNPELKELSEEDKEELCENCENSAYMELRLLENEEETLKLMFDPYGNFTVYESFIDLTVEGENDNED